MKFSFAFPNFQLRADKCLMNSVKIERLSGSKINEISVSDIWKLIALQIFQDFLDHWMNFSCSNNQSEAQRQLIPITNFYPSESI